MKQQNSIGWVQLEMKEQTAALHNATGMCEWKQIAIASYSPYHSPSSSARHGWTEKAPHPFFNRETVYFYLATWLGDQPGFSLIKFQVTALIWVRENLNNSLCCEVKVDDYELIQKREKSAENRFHVDAIKPEASAREDASVVAS